MSRITSLSQNFRTRRWNSTYTNVLKNLKAGDAVDVGDVRKALASKELSAHELEELRPIIKTSASPEVINEILHHTLPKDFSLYFAMTKERPSHLWNERSLLSLLKSNPGRVYTLSDLLKKHASGSVSNEIRKVVLLKLLLGEAAEVRDGEFELTNENVTKAIELLNQMDHTDELDHLLNVLLDHMIAKDTTHTASDITLQGFEEWLNATKLSEVSERRAFLNLSQVVFERDPRLLSKQTLSRIVSYDIEENTPSETEYISQVLQYIEKNHLDIDRKDAEALLLRIQLIETYGINRDRMDLALEKFHLYQAHEKFGIELVQTKLVQAFCYQAFKKKDTTLLKIAETLIVADEIPVKSIAHLILANSCFDSEKSLKIYNDYINDVPKTINKNTKRSSSGLLTECMMIASLYGNDREFAQLLFEKAVQNKIVVDEMEIATMKKVFKVYGDAFADDSWESAEPRLAQYVLRTIKNL